MFITFRRHYLDLLLERERFAGEVLDIGGKKENIRGKFRPPLGSVLGWKYVNLDPKTNPDYCASAENIPVTDQSFDQILLCEVIEHLENPQKVLSECFRVLKPGGRAVITLPFLYGVHPDPQDFQRWTPDRLNRELNAVGFEQIEIRPMGGLIAVTVDLFEMYCHLEFERRSRIGWVARGLRFALRKLLLRWLLRMDANLPHQDWITTGFFVTASRSYRHS